MKSLMAVIDKLDIRRAQVQVEALIVEVDVNKSSNLGVQWILYGQGSSTVPAAVTNFPGSGTGIVNLAAAALGGNTSSTTTGTTGVGGVAGAVSALTTGATLAIGRYNPTSGTNFAAIVQALRSDGSKQHHFDSVAHHHEQRGSRGQVTQEIPLITGQYSNSQTSISGTTSPFTTIPARGSGHHLEGDTGTSMKAIPYQLKIEQEDSSPGAKLTDSATSRPTSGRSRRGVDRGWRHHRLGGLMSDTVTQSEDRVPVLGANPAPGQSLQVAQRIASEEKPPGVHPAQDPARCGCDRNHQRSKYDEVRDEQKKLGKGHINLLPGEKQPVIR